MDNPDNTYKEKVYDFLYRMPVGKEYLIDNLCKAGTREKFGDREGIYDCHVVTLFIRDRVFGWLQEDTEKWYYGITGLVEKEMTWWILTICM